RGPAMRRSKRENRGRGAASGACRDSKPRMPETSATIVAMLQRAICAFAVFAVMTMSAQNTPTPPVAPTHDHREVRHGATVVDPYFWLREKSSPEVVKYLETENAYTEAMTAKLKPFQDTLYKEMLSHIKQTDLEVPVRRGGYLYYIRTEEGKQY